LEPVPGEADGWDVTTNEDYQPDLLRLAAVMHPKIRRFSGGNDLEGPTAAAKRWRSAAQAYRSSFQGSALLL
jgi:hypothetical protein